MVAPSNLDTTYLALQVGQAFLSECGSRLSNWVTPLLRLPKLRQTGNWSPHIKSSSVVTMIVNAGRWHGINGVFLRKAFDEAVPRNTADSGFGSQKRMMRR